MRKPAVLMRDRDGQLLRICGECGARFVERGLLKPDPFGVLDVMPGVTLADLRAAAMDTHMNTADRIKALIEHLDEVIAPPMTPLEAMEALEDIADQIEGRIDALNALLEEMSRKSKED